LHLIMQYIRQGDFHRVLEIGTHIGYSALNFSLVADHVTTIEKDRIFIVEAVQNCLLSDNIELIQANAFDVLKRFNKEKRKFHCIFIDAHKPDYGEFLLLSIPLLEDNGAIFIDNTISHKTKLGTFFKDLENSGLSYKELNVGDGLIIAFKTRKFFQQNKIN